MNSLLNVGFPTLGNPAPAHGGRTCVGPDRFEMYCTNLPPCPEPRKMQDGSWGPFGSWSECTASCGTGYRLRRRVCDDPFPQNGGLECSGCNIEYESCNTHECPEIQKLGSWTPWQLIGNVTLNDEHLEKRYRFICKVNKFDADGIKILKAKEEIRKCFLDGSCHRIEDENNETGFSEWSLWNNCSASCGEGQQHRSRKCLRKFCEGNTKMTRACNVHPCGGL